MSSKKSVKTHTERNRENALTNIRQRGLEDRKNGSVVLLQSVELWLHLAEETKKARLDFFLAVVATGRAVNKGPDWKTARRVEAEDGLDLGQA